MVAVMKDSDLYTLIGFWVSRAMLSLASLEVR